MSMELITLKTFDFAHKAHLLKSLLESEGIDSYIFDENIVTAYHLYSNTVEGIKLKIRKSDFKKVCEILQGTEYEIVFEKSEDIQPASFTKHILSLIFSKAAIATILFCALIILFLYFNKFLFGDEY